MDLRKIVPICVSIFARKENWSRLIQNSIKTFLTDFVTSNSIESFLIEFNYYRGSNIRLSIIAYDDTKQLVCRKVDSDVKSFLLCLPEENDIVTTEDGLFKRFPSNSIQYGLYNLQGKFNFSFISEQRIGLAISKVIFDVFADINVDDESILSLAFYLNICALKILLKDLNEINQVQEYFIENFNMNEMANWQGKDFVEKKYIENRDLLSEIYNDIFFHKNVDKDDFPPFLSKWSLFCKNEIERLSILDLGLSKDRVYYMFLFHLNLSIAKHLGMEANMQFLYHFFISTTLGSKIWDAM